MTSEPKQTVARVLSLALGATTAMWVFLYMALLFSGKTGGEILFIAGGLCLPIASRHAVSLKEGAWVGAVSAILNLLLIGSIVGGKAPNEMMASGLYWVAGLVVISIALGIIGAAFHKGVRDRNCEMDWEFGFFAVASTLVFLMLITGGLVTGFEVGLAVPDWPNSYGYNMLLYPLTEMVSPGNEGVFFEHAHRLIGMFVGLTSMIMVVCVWKWGANTGIKLLATLVFVLVCAQGVVGGLRVTLDNIWLAMVHGVVGQLIFAGFVCLTAMMSPRWKTPTQSSQKGDLRWVTFLCIAMVLQLVLGALYRHMISDELLSPKATHVLYTHIAFAFLVLLFAIVVGIRCMNRDNALLKKLGFALHTLVLVQLLLGGGALVVILLHKGETIPMYEVLVTTAHQANGALLLGISFLTYVWVRRMILT